MFSQFNLTVRLVMMLSEKGETIGHGYFFLAIGMAGGRQDALQQRDLSSYNGQQISLQPMAAARSDDRQKLG